MQENSVQFNTWSMLFYVYKNNFIRTKALVLAKNLRTSYEQSQACCPAKHKNLQWSLLTLSTSVLILAEVIFIVHKFVRGFQPPPLFKAPTPWPSLTPFLKSLFYLPAFLFHPLLRYFRQFPLTFRQPPTALIWPTNLLWFKQLSKGQFYQFNCHFLSKIHF